MATLKKDQFCLEGQADSTEFISVTRRLAQTFTPSVSGNLTKVRLALKANSGGSSLTVRIINGTPGGTTLASQLLTGISTGQYDIYTVTFSVPPSLTAGNVYSIQLDNASTGIYWLQTNASGTANYYTGGAGYNYNSGWYGPAYDYVFVTEMDVAVATPGLDVHIFGCPKDSTTDDVSVNTDYLSQTFTPTISALLSKVEIALARLDGQTAGSATVEIQTTSGGLPTGTAIATQTVLDTAIPVYDPNNTVMRLQVTFSTPPSLTASTLYALVLKFPNAGLSARYTNWTSKNVDQYASGQRMRSTNSGGTWTTESRDMCFGSFMLETTTTTQTITSDAQIQITTTQTVNSNAFAGQETSQNLNADASIGTTTDKCLTSDSFCGQETQQNILADTDISGTTVQTLDSDAAMFAVTSRTLVANGTVSGTSLQAISSNSGIVQVVSQQVLSDTYIIINEPELKLYTSAVPSVETGILSNPLVFSGVIAGEDFEHPDNPFYLWNDKGGIRQSTDANAIIMTVLAFEVRDETVGYSDGNPNQTFTVAFIPVLDDDPTNHPITIKVNNMIWSRVASLLPTGMTDEVYAFDATTGIVTFGDNVHGKIPSLGAIIQASYTPIDIQHGLEVEELDWFGVRSTGIISNPVSIPLERQLSVDANTVSVVHMHLTSVVAVYLDTDPNGLGTNYYTGGTFSPTLGVITLGTSLPDPKTYVFVVYSYVIADDAEPSYTQVGVVTSHQFANAIPSNNAKLLYFRLSPPATANPSGPMNIYFRIRLDYQA